MSDPLFALTPAEPTDQAQPGAAADTGNPAPGGSPEERRRGRLRNLRTRLLTGVPALLGVLALLYFAPTDLLRLFVMAAGVLGMHEYLRLLGSTPSIRLPYKTLIGGAVLISLGGMTGNIQGLTSGVFVTVLLLLLRMLVKEKVNAPIELQTAGAALVGLLWIPWMLGHVSLILRPHQVERSLLIFLVLTLTFSDSLAYAVGSAWGKRPLLPRVSPNKTVEGALGGLAGGFIAGGLAWLLLGGSKAGAFTLWELLPLGMVLAALGQLGDLLESKLKRINGATDSGQFLPGHGGLLDRIDGYLVAAPCLYYYLLLREFIRTW